MTRDTLAAAAARRYTCSIIGRSPIVASGLPGSRDEANRAGMMATTVEDVLESTEDPVDRGGTANNSTPRKGDVLRSEIVPMTLKRGATILGASAAFAAWLAGAATSNRRAGSFEMPPPVTNDKSAAELAAEIDRLHERLRPTAAPRHDRNLFAFGAPRARRSVDTAVDAPRETAAPPVAPALSVRLIGMAEEADVFTAILSTPSGVFLVKEGEEVLSRFRISRVSADVVELIDLLDGSSHRLALK
jgi:hypothetical protein